MASALSLSLRKECADPRLDETAQRMLCSAAVRSEIASFAVIDVFIGGPDLAELWFCGVDPEATGRPSYHPSVLLKLYIYGWTCFEKVERHLLSLTPVFRTGSG